MGGDKGARLPDARERQIKGFQAWRQGAKSSPTAAMISGSPPSDFRL
ncbi:MAG: hypothetical protein LBF93_09365 [Zoogloeaceae bacterium]|nr:hypothetical protein [Zoogloeaceae bacterium]